jgi:fluoride exporter
MEVTTVILVILGSAAGGMARYGLSGLLAERAGPGFPWGTLCVNVAGCLAIGLFFGWTGTGPLFLAAPAAHQLATYGFLGGFTTFSTYSLEALNLAREGDVGKALAYVAATTGAGLAAVLAGFTIGA